MNAMAALRMISLPTVRDPTVESCQSCLARASCAPTCYNPDLHGRAPPMNSAKGEPWAFTDWRFLYLPRHCFSVPVLKPQVQSHSIALGSGGGHNPMSLESKYRVWRSL